MVIALLGILWWAVHSGRVVAAILLATFMGLIMTAALGLLVTGRFNLISVAFIPLFVGLGIDFSIQFSVRFLAERHFHPGLREALVAAGRGVGLPLAVAAAAIGAGFFAFLPTDYIGVAELGLIAGLGMAVAFALAVTLLPALLALLRPPARPDGSGLRPAGADRELPWPPSSRRARPGLRGRGRGGGGAALRALRLQPAASQEPEGRVDGDPRGPRRRSRLDAQHHQRHRALGSGRRADRAPARRPCRKSRAC